MTTVIGPIDIEEERPVTFAFSGELKTDETLASVASVEVTVLAGTDPTPLSLLVGAASISGATVSQLVKPGVLGATYHLRCVAVTSLGSTVVVAANLRIVQF